MNFDFLNFNTYNDNLDSLFHLYNVSVSLGNKYFDEQNYEKSIESYQKALTTNLRLINLVKENNLTESIPIDKLNYLKYKLYLSYMKQGGIIANKSNFEEALKLFENALVINPRDFQVYHKIGLCLYKLNISDAAKKFMLKCSELNPKLDEAYRTIGDILHFKEKNSLAAIEYYEKYIELNQSNYLVYNMLGYLYSNYRNINQALEYYKTALSLKPDVPTIINDILLCTLKKPGLSQKDIYETTLELINSYLKYIKFDESKVYTHKKPNNPNKKLHIGYISADFRHHAVMYFIEPILKNHNKDKFTISCYSNVQSEDGKTKICRSLVHHFKEIKNLSNKEIAELIKKDRVDILVDLTGHTGHSKTLALAYKPAPIQAVYCGYPNTTGLSAIDYILTDRITIKEDEELFFSEKPAFIDFGYECYNIHHEDFPEITPLPALKNEYITFGFFNCLSKVNDSLMKLWADLLKTVPNSKLLLHRSTLGEVKKKEIIDKMEEFGIKEDRLILKNDKAKHYNFIEQADIALDAFPYNGTTTTIDSLYMGLPVICIYGEGPTQRSSARINTYMGLTEFIAKDKEEFVNIAASIANDIEKLKELRATLRDRFKNSSLVDHKGFTESLENTYMKMWQKYIESK